jgi:hypothetical protein
VLGTGAIYRLKRRHLRELYLLPFLATIAIPFLFGGLLIMIVG